MPECYFCGEVNQTHEHHIIPQRWSPLRNQTAQVCPQCHQQVEEFYRILLQHVAENPRVLDEYRGQDGQSKRQRQVATALGGPVPEVLPDLYEKEDGNMTAILNEVNRALDGQQVSRPTLYEWCADLGLRDE